MDIEQFLQVISQIESSGGKDLDHPMIKSGLHAGTSAIGKYGLMPLTAQDIAKKIDDPLAQQIINMPKEQISDYIKENPGLEDQLARKLAEHVLSRQGDPEMAAYSWNQGHYLTPKKIKDRNYQDHDYVKKFRKLRDTLIAGN